MTENDTQTKVGHLYKIVISTGVQLAEQNALFSLEIDFGLEFWLFGTDLQ